MTSHERNIPNDRRLWRRYADAMAAERGELISELDLAAYVDGRATDQQRDEIEAYLAAHLEAFDAVRDARAAASRDEPATFVAPTVLAAAKGLVHAGERSPARRERFVFDWRLVGRWTAAAAASVIVCLFGYQAGFNAGPAEPTGEAALVDAMTFGALGNGESAADIDVYALLLEGES
jgi:anti-sigma factor RsiW